MTLLLNGESREFDLADSATLQQLIDVLGLQGDRIAVEHNGAIIGRGSWGGKPLAENDKLEIVHFVGGG